MTSPNKRKGDRHEISARGYAELAGIPTERTKAGYARDAGDIHFYASAGGRPFVIGQCKAERQIDLSGYLRDAETQRQEAQAAYAVAIVKRKGVADPGQQYTVMTYQTFLCLLAMAAKAAGRTPTPEEN